MQDENGRAIQAAYRLLGYRQRSIGELTARLAKKGFSTESIEAAILKLNDYGFLNDGALAENLSHEASEHRGLGRLGARAYMRRRGIGSEQIDSALDGYDEREAARKFVSRRLKTLAGLPREVLKRRLYGQLARRGYSADTIFGVMKEAGL